MHNQTYRILLILSAAMLFSCSALKKSSGPTKNASADAIAETATQYTAPTHIATDLTLGICGVYVNGKVCGNVCGSGVLCCCFCNGIRACVFCWA